MPRMRLVLAALLIAGCGGIEIDDSAGTLPSSPGVVADQAGPVGVRMAFWFKNTCAKDALARAWRADDGGPRDDWFMVVAAGETVDLPVRCTTGRPVCFGVYVTGGPEWGAGATEEQRPDACVTCEAGGRPVQVLACE